MLIRRPPPMIPTGAVKVRDKASDGFAYIYVNGRGQPCAMAFHGTSAKPAWIYAFLSVAAREARIRSFFEARARTVAMKAERKAERLKPIACSWGMSCTAPGAMSRRTSTSTRWSA